MKAFLKNNLIPIFSPLSYAELDITVCATVGQARSPPSVAPHALVLPTQPVEVCELGGRLLEKRPPDNTITGQPAAVPASNSPAI